MAKLLDPHKYAEPGTELAHQIALFIWISQNLEQYPDLRWFFAVPNGGFRTKIEAARFRAQGVKKGVPDTFLPVRRGQYGGLWIELKKPASLGYDPGKPSKEQKEWIDFLKSQGYGAIVCYGWESARDTLIEYINYKGK